MKKHHIPFVDRPPPRVLPEKLEVLPAAVLGVLGVVADIGFHFAGTTARGLLRDAALDREDGYKVQWWLRSTLSATLYICAGAARIANDDLVELARRAQARTEDRGFVNIAPV